MDDDDEPHSNNDGLSIATAGIFIIGEICGAGAVSFPQALSKTGLAGMYFSCFKNITISWFL